MKTNLFCSIPSLWVLMMMSFAANAQMPLPCLDYTNDNVTTLYGFHGSKSVGCMEINMEETPIHMNDDDVRDYQVQTASIKPGYSYVPSGENGRFSITLGERDVMEGAWFEPINYFPQLYEKIEWGLKLPPEVEQAIDNWINNDQYWTEHYPVLNPFDPEQIDVKAIVDYTDESGNYHSQPVFGFFYRDYQRITVYNNPYGEIMDDPDNWRWDEVPTEHRFRFRWESDVIAHHSVRLTVNVPTMGYWELAPFEFDSYWGDPRNSFISVTDNGHYFKTADNHVFFPVGLNINEGTFGCSCIEAINDSPVDDCDDCYELGYDDPCCGIRIDKKKRYLMPGISLLDRVVAPAGFVKLERILNILKNSGGNSFRNIIEPITFDVEFEKLNNYYDRQFLGWEYDRTLDLAHELNLRIECTMLIHYGLGHHGYGGDNFDWDNQENCTPCPPRANDSGFAYWNGCSGSDDPLEFLYNPCMIENYKKKLRYFIARWGYSKEIYLFDLVSEMNNIGLSTIYNLATSAYETPPLPYDVDQLNVRPLVASWHTEMARYIKEELHHKRHLITADYTGVAPLSRYTDSPEVPCSSEYFDDSWQSPHIDVIGYNDYNIASDRFLRMAESSYQNLYCWTANYEYTGENYEVSVPGFFDIPKPVVHPESGFLDAFPCDYTGFVKEIMAVPFTGNASTGMSWDEWSSTEHWHWMEKSKSFLENEVLNNVDLGTETWIPSRILSEDGRAEVVYLRKIDDNHKKLVGVIMNRTWNWFTVGDGGNCDQIPVTWNAEQQLWMVDDAILPYYMHNLNNVGDDASHIKIPQMENFKTYHIEYIDVNDLSTINEETVNTIDSKLRLENYPLLSEQRPFAFFKVWRDPIGDEEDGFMQLQINEPFKSQSLEESTTIMPDNINNTMFDQRKINIIPNPMTKSVQISTSTSCDCALLNAFGQRISSISLNIGDNEFDFENLSVGIYFLKCSNSLSALKIIKI